MLTLPAGAQVVPQTFTNLHAGWNSIWVEVEPTINAIEVVFADPAVEAVWAYFDKTSTADFIRNANELPFNNPSWRRWFPTNSPKAVINTLFTVNAQRAYLVKLTNAVTLAITGRPSVRPLKWVPDSFNLRGFPIDPGLPPATDDFFAPAPAHAGQPVYRLAANGLWQQVAGYTSDGGGLPVPIPGTNSLQSGVAYWVWSNGGSDFTAPLEISLEAGDGLDYAKTLDEQNLQLRNRSTNFTYVTMENLSAGSLPLAYYVINAPSGANWVNLPSPFSRDLSGGRRVSWRLAIQRTSPSFTTDAYATVLRVTDGLGTRYLLPVSAGKVTSSAGGGGGGGARLAGASGATDYTGLWVGNALLDAVSDANALKMTVVTSGGVDSALARAVFLSPGTNDDFAIVARNPGAAYNGLVIVLETNGAASGTNAVASFAADAAGAKYLTIGLKPGLTNTTAGGVIRAVNACAATNDFLTNYLAILTNSTASTGVVTQVAVLATTGGAGDTARAVFSFPGPNNDFHIAARTMGTAGNGLNVFLKSDGTATNGAAGLSYDATGKTLTMDIDRGVTTAQTLITALNGLSTNGFNAAYQAQSANGEGATGILAETTPTSAANGGGSQFPLRLILHVDQSGTTRLLKQVIQLWKDGAYITNPTNGLLQVDTNNPGRFVLLTDDARIMDFQGATLRDGEPVGRRISSVGFDFDGLELLMAGAFGTGSLAVTNQVPAALPTNPFLHRKHPDHTNGLAITREIQLSFQANAPPGLSAVDYGYNVIAGGYREKLNGLHHRPLVVTGTFRLNRLSFIGELNPR